MSEMQVTFVPNEYAFSVWPMVRAQLAASAEYTHGRFDPEDILELLVDGAQHLWVAHEGRDVLGAVTTNFVAYPRKRVLCMHFCGGVDLKNWKDLMLTTLRTWAQENGCDAIECSGRPGWAKIFAHDGHTPLWNTFELPLHE